MNINVHPRSHEVIDESKATSRKRRPMPLLAVGRSKASPPKGSLPLRQSPANYLISYRRLHSLLVDITPFNHHYSL